MDDREKRALGALAMMVRQFVRENDERGLDSTASSAEEHAITALAEYGYIDEHISGRIFGRWTDAGRALLEWSYPFSEQNLKPFPMPPKAVVRH